MDIIERVKEVLEQETYIDQRDGDNIGYEIYVSYDEELDDSYLAKISKADHSTETLNDILEEWIFNSEGYYYSELLEILKKKIEDYDDYEDVITDWIQEHVYWYLPEKVYGQEVNVVVALDTGDANTDFTECNILNWYGTAGGYNPGKTIPENSPIRFIAESQGKMEEVEHIVRLELDEAVTSYSGDYFSKFAQSIVQELENSPSHMNTFIFLLKMSLRDFCKLREQMMTKEGTITISPKTECGLYDPWSGGGSVLEVELEKEVVVPMDKIWDAWIDCGGCKANGHGYGVDEVYGLCGYVWEYGGYKIAECA